jgi:ABC-type glycerol-3-phosphate transport system substrate-binding protein
MDILRIVAAIGVFSLITACIPFSTSVSESEEVHLTLWHAYGGAFGEQFERLVEDFNDAHPDIIVEPSYGGSLWTMRDKLFIAIAGDAAPDLTQIDQFWSSELADAGAIIPMERFLKADPAFGQEDIWPLAWKTATYEDVIWSMPFSLSNIALYYNRWLFYKAGLDPDAPPTTWEELEAVATTLTQDTDGDSIVDQWGLSIPMRANRGVVYYWFAFLWQAGGEIFSTDYTKPHFHETAGVEALAFLQRLVKAGSLPLEPPEEGFEHGQIAMTLASTARLSRYIEALEDDLGVASLPCGRECVTGVGGANLAILATCAHPQEAWEFVRWMSTSEVNLRWSTQTGYLPLRRSVIASEAYQEYLAAEPRAAVILEQMKVAYVRPNIPSYAAVSREVGLAVEEALFTGGDPSPALSAAAARSITFLGR